MDAGVRLHCCCRYNYYDYNYYDARMLPAPAPATTTTATPAHCYARPVTLLRRRRLLQLTTPPPSLRYIGHYSLPSWLRLADERGERNLSRDDLLGKLDLIDTLMRADEWGTEANSAYDTLFNVDVRAKEKELPGVGPKAEQKLMFNFLKLCQYPEMGEEHYGVQSPDDEENGVWASLLENPRLWESLLNSASPPDPDPDE